MEAALQVARKTENKSSASTHGCGSSLAPAAAHPLISLQQQAGNQAVQVLLRSLVQTKLAISNPGDPDEREADQVADRIMRMHGGAPISSPCSCSGGEEMCEECAQKQTGVVSRRASNVLNGHPADSQRTDDSGGRGSGALSMLHRDGGQLLDASTRALFEPRFGHDFSDVRVHTGEQAAESAQSIQALAYTAGNHIAFGAQQYQPSTESGQRLLAHELAHVVQQRASSGAMPPTLARKAPAGVHCSQPWTCAATPCQQPDTAGNGAPSTGWDLDLNIDTDVETASQITSAADVGHTYVVFKESNGAQYSYGFYPLPGLHPDPFRTREVYGCVVHSDTAHTSCVDFTESYHLSQDQYNKALKLAQLMCAAPPHYNLSTYNCTTFAVDIAKEAGQSPPSPRGKVGGGYVADNPNTLKEGFLDREVPTWRLTSDTEIRAWVAAHDAIPIPGKQGQTISTLPADEKIRLLNRLLDGWVSDDDVAAFEKICSSITNAAERKMTQDQVGPRENDLKSADQRTRVHNALFGSAPATPTPSSPPSTPSLPRSGQIQPKLAISNPEDPDEREADQVADRIMRMHGGAPVSSQCSCSGGEEVCEECKQKQTAAVARSASDVVQRQQANPGQQSQKPWTPNAISSGIQQNDPPYCYGESGGSSGLGATGQAVSSKAFSSFCAALCAHRPLSLSAWFHVDSDIVPRPGVKAGDVVSALAATARFVPTSGAPESVLLQDKGDGIYVGPGSPLKTSMRTNLSFFTPPETGSLIVSLINSDRLSGQGLGIYTDQIPVNDCPGTAKPGIPVPSTSVQLGKWLVVPDPENAPLQYTVMDKNTPYHGPGAWVQVEKDDNGYFYRYNGRKIYLPENPPYPGAQIQPSQNQPVPGQSAPVQRSAEGDRSHTDDLTSHASAALSVLREGGHPLDAQTRAFFEPRFGHDFSNVRLHTGGQAAESAHSIQALAYTAGNHIVFGTQQYQPSTEQGRQLLAHELTHTIQQGAAQAVGTTNSRPGVQAQNKDFVQRQAGHTQTGPSAAEQKAIALRWTDHDIDFYHNTVAAVATSFGLSQAALWQPAHDPTFSFYRKYTTDHPRANAGDKILVTVSLNHWPGRVPEVTDFAMVDAAAPSPIPIAPPAQPLPQPAPPCPPCPESPRTQGCPECPPEAPVFLCNKPVPGHAVHRQGHLFLRVGGSGPGNPTFELEHDSKGDHCKCGFQGIPQRDYPEDRDATDADCIPAPTVTASCLAAKFSSYPVGMYCALGPNSNTYAHFLLNACGGTGLTPPGNVPGFNDSPPIAGTSNNTIDVRLLICDCTGCNECDSGVCKATGSTSQPDNPQPSVQTPIQRREDPNPSHAAQRMLPDRHLLALQQQAGNQAVQSLLRASLIQAKLAISQPDDPAEHEADQVADRIMRMHSGAPTSSPCSCSGSEEMCEECQKKQPAAVSRSASGVLQRQSTNPQPTPQTNPPLNQQNNPPTNQATNPQASASSKPPQVWNSSLISAGVQQTALPYCYGESGGNSGLGTNQKTTPGPFSSACSHPCAYLPLPLRVQFHTDGVQGPRPGVNPGDKVARVSATVKFEPAGGGAEIVLLQNQGDATYVSPGHPLQTTFNTVLSNFTLPGPGQLIVSLINSDSAGQGLGIYSDTIHVDACPGVSKPGIPVPSTSVQLGKWLVVPDPDNAPLQYSVVDKNTPINGPGVMVQVEKDDKGYFYRYNGRRVDLPGNPPYPGAQVQPGQNQPAPTPPAPVESAPVQRSAQDAD
jgi:hypothetical protein